MMQQPGEHFLNNNTESCKSSGETLCGFLGNSSERLMVGSRFSIGSTEGSGVLLTHRWLVKRQVK